MFSCLILSLSVTSDYFYRGERVEKTEEELEELEDATIISEADTCYEDDFKNYTETLPSHCYKNLIDHKIGIILYRLSLHRFKTKVVIPFNLLVDFFCFFYSTRPRRNLFYIFSLLFMLFTCH